VGGACERPRGQSIAVESLIEGIESIAKFQDSTSSRASLMLLLSKINSCEVVRMTQDKKAVIDDLRITGFLIW
jgi:hypothetical protein